MKKILQNKIEKWHQKTDVGISLNEYLNMTWEEYEDSFMEENDKQLFFRLRLTENEHDAINFLFNQYCLKINMKLHLIYYRRIKQGHIPMIREIKFVGDKQEMNKFKDICRDYKKYYKNYEFAGCFDHLCSIKWSF